MHVMNLVTVQGTCVLAQPVGGHFFLVVKYSTNIMLLPPGIIPPPFVVSTPPATSPSGKLGTMTIIGPHGAPGGPGIPPAWRDLDMSDSMIVAGREWVHTYRADLRVGNKHWWGCLLARVCCRQRALAVAHAGTRS